MSSLCLWVGLRVNARIISCKTTVSRKNRTVPSKHYHTQPNQTSIHHDSRCQTKSLRTVPPSHVEHTQTGSIRSQRRKDPNLKLQISNCKSPYLPHASIRLAHSATRSGGWLSTRPRFPSVPASIHPSILPSHRKQSKVRQRRPADISQQCIALH